MTDSPEALALSARDFVQAEPLLRLLTRVPFAPLTLGIAYALIFMLLRGITARASGCLLSTGGALGFVDDPALYTNIVFGTGIAALYLWVPRGLAAVFNGLCTNKVIAVYNGAAGNSVPDDEGPALRARYADFLAEMRGMFNRWWWAAAAAVIGIGGPVLFVLPGYLRHYAAQDWCAMINPFSVVLALLWVIIPFYGLVIALIYCILGILWLNRLFRRFTIYVRPLHPDRAGGLSPLGTFSLRLSYAITLIGFILVLTSITRYYVTTRQFGFAPEIELIAGLVLYLSLAPVVFFAPLSAAHRSMREAKENLLLKIDETFATHYNTVQTLLDEDLAGLETRIQSFKELQELHDIVRSFPVWPFNAESLRRFGTSWLSPIALGLVVEAAARFL